MKQSPVKNQQARLEQNYTTFQRLVSKSKAYLSRGQYNYSAVLAEIAAYHATWKHNGLFASYELEEILQSLAQKTIQVENTSPVKNPSDIRRVLHIASMVSGQAGLQHLLRRWIELDASRCHSVAVSQPSTGSVPEKLESVVAAAGGSIELVGNNYEGIIERAQRIRYLATEADLVVLHLQTEDVAPIIGLSQKIGLPPVVLINHADHCFWVGATVIDLVINLRNSGLALCKERRGINPERLTLLPTPLEPINRTISRQEAKASLGLPMNAVLILSVARGPKYRPWDEINFPLVHVPLLQKHQECFLYVLGPEHSQDWEYASQQTGGRIKAFGTRSDAFLFFQSADIYVDAFPMVSITSLLEGGGFALPLVSCRLYPAKPEVWCADAPGIDKYLLRCQDIDDYRNKLCCLVEDMEFRAEVGKNTQEEINRIHIGEAWLKSLETVYAHAKMISREPVADAQSQRDISELDLLMPNLMNDNKTIEEVMFDQYRHLLPPTWLHFRVRTKLFLVSLIKTLGLKKPIKKAIATLKNKSS
jgi:hypothetical protein